MSATLSDLFRHQAEQCESKSPLYAELCRRAADDPVVEAVLAGYTGWDAPLRLLGAVHSLVLAGRAPTAFDGWEEFCTTLVENRALLSRLVRERPVQTNEVRRSWTLLPCFLEIVRRTGAGTLDLIELGSSAGLNLVWDRYRYRYERGEWGTAEAPIVLTGEERTAVPADLLELDARVGRRVGIDLHPVDVTSEGGALALRSFVWAGQPERLELLDRAIDVVRAEPPGIVRGDVVELLPQLLADRRNEALTVVFSTATLGYLPEEGRERVKRTLDAAGAAGPLAFVATGRPEEGVHTHWGLWLQLWPGGERELLAEADFHGRWLRWIV